MYTGLNEIELKLKRGVNSFHINIGIPNCRIIQTYFAFTYLVFHFNATLLDLIVKLVIWDNGSIIYIIILYLYFLHFIVLKGMIISVYFLFVL